MTDKEIIKALECCKGGLCCGCPRLSNGRLTGACMHELITDVLDLINRQQAEIEDLNHSIDTLGRVKEQLKETLSETEAKYQKEITRLDALLVCKNKVIRGLDKSFENAYDGAIKEFVEKLKEDLKSNNYIVSFDRIDNLVKEMVG